MNGFRNEPILELRRSGDRQKLLDGLTELDQRLPIRAAVWVGRDQRHGDDLPNTDPGNPERLVATAAKATPEEAQEAVARAAQAFRAWDETPVRARAEILVRAAAIMRERCFLLAALAVRE